MSDYSFDTDQAADEFLRDVALEMMCIFGMPKSEAVGRIEAHFDGLTLVGEGCVIYGEPPSYWALDITYGHHTQWWNNLETATQLPYVS